MLPMRLPRGGLPGVDPEALLLVRAPIYQLIDSGSGGFQKHPVSSPYSTISLILMRQGIA